MTNPVASVFDSITGGPSAQSEVASLQRQNAQLRTELRSYITSHKLTAGPGAIFYLLTPPDVTVCTDAGTTNGHCSDSSRTNPWTAFAGRLSIPGTHFPAMP